MSMLTVLPGVWVPLVLAWADKVPAPEDVKAGWGAFALFIALAVAVAFLGFSLSRHLRTARENAERGLFGPGEGESAGPGTDPGTEPGAGSNRDGSSDDGEPHRNTPTSTSP